MLLESGPADRTVESHAAPLSASAAKKPLQMGKEKAGPGLRESKGTMKTGLGAFIPFPSVEQGHY